jgi:hypothetical protein
MKCRVAHRYPRDNGRAAAVPTNHLFVAFLGALGQCTQFGGNGRMRVVVIDRIGRPKSPLYEHIPNTQLWANI